MTQASTNLRAIICEIAAVNFNGAADTPKERNGVRLDFMHLESFQISTLVVTLLPFSFA